MSDLQNKLDKVISDIEKRLTNKEDFEYVKTQIYNIYTIFLDEFDKLEAKCNEKMEDIAIRCKVLDDRMSEIEDSIEKELLICTKIAEDKALLKLIKQLRADGCNGLLNLNMAIETLGPSKGENLAHVVIRGTGVIFEEKEDVSSL